MKYQVTVGSNPDALDVEVHGAQVRLGVEDLVARITALQGTPLYQLSIGDESWTVAVEPLDGDRWILSAAGARVEVVVVPAGARRAPDVVPRARRHGAGPVVAPMPGLVVRVRVTQGQRVDAGAGLVVVEAMKMENELRAPRGGVVTAVYVAPGATVEKGQPLVTIGDG